MEKVVRVDYDFIMRALLINQTMLSNRLKIQSVSWLEQLTQKYLIVGNGSGEYFVFSVLGVTFYLRSRSEFPFGIMWLACDLGKHVTNSQEVMTW